MTAGRSFGAGTGSRAGERYLLDAGVLAVLLLLFLGFADWNYRSRDGYLGRTTPVWQTEILSGAAPAPYVYRQGVPQLRRMLGAALLPGHAAVVADLLFAALATASGLALARRSLGPAQRWSGGLLALFACAAVYPNDKPEAVAMVALAVLLVTLALTGRDRAAAVVAMVAVPFRPELPVLFGLAFCCAELRHRRAGSRRRAFPAAGYAAASVAGLGYLAASRFLFWPQAAYPAGTGMFTLLDNLTLPRRYVGLALGLVLLAAGVAWAARGWLGASSVSAELSRSPADPRASLGLGLFVALWVLASLTMGKADELRLLLPVLPVCLLFALGPPAPRVGT